MTIITGPNLLRKYNDLRAIGYTVLWRGNGQIAMQPGGTPYAPPAIVEMPPTR